MQQTTTIVLKVYEKKQLLKLKEYTDSHLHEALAAEEMALQWDLSMYKLKAGFMLLFGNSFNDYKKTRRMEKAGELLLTTNKILYVIALECGYRDESAFVRAFRKWHGQTPNAFRKG